MKNPLRRVLTAAILLAFSQAACPGDVKNAQNTAPGSALRELIVSHSDGDGVLQLYRMKEDGTNRMQLTYSKRGCRMPTVSPDGKKLAFIQQSERSVVLCLSDLNGKNIKVLTDTGVNLIPSWLPDSKHIVWMITQGGGDPSLNSQIHLCNTETGESRRLFSDPQQLMFSNSMPVVSPDGRQIAFISNRSGHMRLWVSKLDGTEARLVSPPEVDIHETIQAPIEQKVPAWSPDGNSIAYWEGVEMKHMSRFTGVENRKRDQQIAATFHVWVVSADGKNRRKSGPGDDPTWSPDGFVTRAFPDQERGGPKVMMETATTPKQLPLVPPGAQFGRFTWIPERPKNLPETGN